MANLVYFENSVEPIETKIIEAESSIETTIMKFEDGSEACWRALEASHGYQALPSTETDAEFYPNANMISRCPNLLAVSAAGAGYDMFDVAACTEAGVLVVNQSGANAESVAQHALGLMLALSKQIVQSDRAIRRAERNWTRWDYTGNELTGRTLGIIGLGNVGRRLAQIAKVFSMNVISYDPLLTPADFVEREAKSVTLEELVRTADFVSVNCPLTDQSAGMIGEPQFNAMKPDVIFVSTARGGIHNEVALEKALESRKVSAAGLDVFEAEPPAHDHPLLRFDNVIASPHNAGITTDCLNNMGVFAASQWVDIFAGKRPPRLINPDAWPKYAARFEGIMGKPVTG